MKKFKKILILGSGALKIWEAWEFDYSWSQAIKACREEWIKTVLVNPNIATVQTDPWFADTIYYLPVTPEFVEDIIVKEKPDGIMLSFGGQTALNCWLELQNSWILKKYGVVVLWTPTHTIEITEDRKLFNKQLDEIGVVYANSKTADNEKWAIKIAENIWYPVLVRAAFALWGLGSWFAENEKELKQLLKKAFSYSSQVIIDESLKWWKELEYEVVRDASDNCITVCNMENFDPMWIHTGESIVIAPSQTLSNTDHQIMRDVALKTIRHLWVIGECNIQFAYNPQACQYRVIEVNARLSRSSALASKVTGYPLAYVAAKIGLGYNLDEIKNSVTQKTSAFFEPSLDYVVCKIPRWDLDKFDKVDQKLWSEMKSVWEVMAIWRSIEEVLQKALRNLDIGMNGLVANEREIEFNKDDLNYATPKRIFAIARAFISGKDIHHIENKTMIDPFFLEKIKNIVETKNILEQNTSQKLWVKDKEIILKSKKQWYSDIQISKILWVTEKYIRSYRLKQNITPSIKKIDTLAGEFPSYTNYMYSTYHGNHDDTKASRKKNKVIVLWSGSYRIWCSVEFDWCSVSTLKALKENGYETIMINFNPETVSTDFDSSDKLYFEEISLESVLDIYTREKASGVIVSMGWQIANNLANALDSAWVKVLGTNPKDIDRAEDRDKFSSILDSIWVDQPKWAKLTSAKEALAFWKSQWYPVIIRPSYVLSGANMQVCEDKTQLEKFLKKIAHISPEFPSVISKFESWAKEVEIDGVAHNGELKIYAITEHVENAWVHSWDATVLLPAQKLYIETIRKIKKICKQVIKELNITGPFNIQFLAKENMIKVIECNVRASRSFPFVSKVTGYNFIEMATKAIIWKDISGNYNTLDFDYVWVKAPQFSFHRLKWADPKLWIEMASTWEVGCIGSNIHEAFLAAMISVGVKVPKKWVLVSLGTSEDKIEFLESIKILESLWYKIYATAGTYKIFKKHGYWVKYIDKLSENSKKNALTLIEDGKVDLVINSLSQEDFKETSDGYLLRRTAVDKWISLINNTKVAKLFIESLEYLHNKKTLDIKSYSEIVGK